MEREAPGFAVDGDRKLGPQPALLGHTLEKAREARIDGTEHLAQRRPGNLDLRGAATERPQQRGDPNGRHGS